MVIRNYIQNVAEDMMPAIMKNSNVCNCEKCKLDILAIVLNNVKPKYVVTEKGELYARLSALQSQFQVDIIAEITKACVIVKNNPRH